MNTPRTDLPDASEAHASDSELRNQLLIAMPSLADPNFARSVTLICQHSAEGAMGIVLNRSTPLLLGDVFEQLGIECADRARAAQPVLAGGPVQAERGFVVHDGDHGWDSSHRVAAELWVTTSRDVLVALARNQGPTHALLALGYAGWGAGQLDDELRDNAWLTAPADHALLFATPFQTRWAAAAQSVGVDLARMTTQAGRA